MKCTIPEISWHNRDPVLSVDVQPVPTSDHVERLATGGTDSHVLIWHVEIQQTGTVKVEFAADLQRHQRAVNVVRFSPSGEYLASGDDESVIIIWKQKTDQDAPEMPMENDIIAKEQWLGVRVLRGHVEDVYDLSWSPDSMNLISGSVDNSAIIWDVHKGRNLSILKDHKGFVQGVTWDPNNQYVATLCSDRTCRVYNINSKKLVSRICKATLPVSDSSDLHGKVLRLFHDDTLKSFFRRLSFSPDGQLLVAPSGIIENSDKNTNATHIFVRRMLNRPVMFLPTNNQYTVAVRFCPVLFQLRERDTMFTLPYRMVMAVATQNSVLLYDTQQPEPFGIISNIHYTRLTDITWSSNGRMLIVSSTDGYCSIITFSEGELGKVYKCDPKEETAPVSDTSNGSSEMPNNNRKVEEKVSKDPNTTTVIQNETKSKENITTVKSALCNQTTGESVQTNESDKTSEKAKSSSASDKKMDFQPEEENLVSSGEAVGANKSDKTLDNSKTTSANAVETNKSDQMPEDKKNTSASEEKMDCQPGEENLVSSGDAVGAKKSDKTSENSKTTSADALQANESDKTSENTKNTSADAVEASKSDKIPEDTKNTFAADEKMDYQSGRENQEKKDVTLISPRTSEDKCSDITKKGITTNKVKAPRRVVPIFLSGPSKTTNKDINPTTGNTNITIPPRRIQPMMLLKPIEKSSDDEVKGKSDSEVHHDELKVSDKNEANDSVPRNTVNTEKNVPEKENSQKNSSIVIAGESDIPKNKKPEKPVLNESKQTNAAEGIDKSEKTVANVSEPMEIDVNNDKACTPKQSASASPPVSPMPLSLTTSQEKRTPRRVQFITLSSPKSKKKLL